MILQENETTEFKEEFTVETLKDILAFANSQGGKLYIGIQDDGTVVGLSQIKEQTLRLTNSIRDNIRPDLTMSVSLSEITISGHTVLVAEVQRGVNRPYYLASKGLRPEGVYVRQASSSAPASAENIRQVVKETDGDIFEEKRSLNQDLTFDYAINEFAARGLDLIPSQMQTLKMMDSDKIFSNLGWLLSDQCTTSVKVGVFSGTTQSIFQDRREFTGSILQQLNDVYDFLDRHNQTKANFDKLLRIDVKDYPDVALREALLNSVIHRDYSFRASTLISLYSDRIEFVSIGGLLPGINYNDISVGLSACRNFHLANVFYRLQFIEAYGTGLKKIREAYQHHPIKPTFIVTDNAFKVTLPNMNQTEFVVKETRYQWEDEQTAILKLLRTHEFIDRAMVETTLGVSTTTAYRYLMTLIEKGVIVRIGRGKNTRYRLK